MNNLKDFEVTLTYAGMELRCLLLDIDADECNQWTQGVMHCGVFRHHQQVFFVLDNGLGMTWADGLNIFRLKGKKLFDWLQLQSGRVDMQLWEQKTRQLVARRAFAFPTAIWQQLITALHYQYQSQKGKEEVDRQITKLIEKTDAYAMMASAVKKGRSTDIV